MGCYWMGQHMAVPAEDVPKPAQTSRWAVNWVWHPVAVLPGEAKVCFASYNFASKVPCWQDTETPSWRKMVWTSPYFPCACHFMCHPAWHFTPLQHSYLLFWISSTSTPFPALGCATCCTLLFQRQLLHQVFPPLVPFPLLVPRLLVSRQHVTVTSCLALPPWKRSFVV